MIDEDDERLERLERHDTEILKLLRGDEWDREDGGLVGDMRDVKRYVKARQTWEARIGMLLIAGAVTALFSLATGKLG